MEKKKKSKLKLNRRRIIVLIVLAIICALFIWGTVSLFKLIFSDEKIVGNYANMGLAVENGKTTFYNKYEEGIVKVKAGEEYQITDETAYSMNVIGDTIYYLTLSNSNTLDLKSVKDNGDEPTKIQTLSTPLSKFYIEDGYVYYVSNKDSVGIVKLSLETKEEKKIVTANIQDFVVQNKTIYYTDSVGYLHSISINGDNLVDISKDHNIKKIQVLNKWIYFYNVKEKSLCKIRNNGEKYEVAATFVNNEMYNVTSKYIYYFDEVNGQICRCDLKGKKSTPIVSLNTTRTKINIAGDTLYYLDDSESETRIYEMKRVKTNGGAISAIEY